MLLFSFPKNVYIWQNINRYHLDVGANWVVAQYPGRFEVMPLNVLPNINIRFLKMKTTNFPLIRNVRILALHLRC